MQATSDERRATKYDFCGKNVLIMGLGRFGGGVDSARFAATAGAKVTVTDLASADQLTDSVMQLGEFPDMEFHLGSHDLDDFERGDIIIVNPAVSPDHEFLQLARRLNKFVTSQIEIFFELCPARIIGITGANGKSTTTALAAYLLKAASHKTDGPQSNVIAGAAKQSQPQHDATPTTHCENVWLSGNIGNEPLLTILDQISPNDLVVLELSSFQLEQLARIQKAPQVALLTNLTPNHLDRYGTFANYCAAKENVFKFQKLNGEEPAVSIFNPEDEVAAEWFAKYSEDTGRICIRFSPDDVGEEIRSSFLLPGRANLSNLAAALAVAKHFHVTDDQIKNALPKFKPLRHRLELVAQINGVRWYNDSKATTPQGAIVALQAFDQPKIIIAGGYDKHLPFDALGREIAKSARAAILLGQTAETIAAAIRSARVPFPASPTLTSLQRGPFPASLRGAKRRSNLNQPPPSHRVPKTRIEIVDSLSRAVALAHRLAVPGDVVLLSPACASYDMFDNFEQRGQDFCRLVQQISS
jgi:UDP-N-acetylmuramoylalanine--D-glutamate ligase